ncbi:NAD(P)-binding protein [Rhodofomes roseus]|uniref:NAD(P)-binding protein n=1 Tax=Rhodofomes roseus TaxID=34475 RepID=A0ABQ8KLU3_9APHY|nr:NAD(P)-binding protein [Rhodofomes roseus]KAH9838557.1 NAD(P)-binding protein [Rhodofomes roseus]
MPAITSGKILVTGANGYIALWLVRKLLDQGYAVRGTVRSEGKARHLRETFRSHNRLETIVIEDITKEGAFDEAVNGVDAIAHLASPVVLGVDNPEELIAPAVRGTMRVFESALAYGTSVQRIVLTSSCAAIREFRDLPRTFTEEDWNDASLAEVRARGPAASITDKYCASKVLAERAAWEFVEKNRREGKIGWDLVVICPSYVFGPPMLPVRSPAEMANSLREWYETVIVKAKDQTDVRSDGMVVEMCWVDVRDVAEAHVLAFQKKEAGEERIIASEGPWRWQDFVKAAHEADACLPPGDATYDPTVAGHSFLFDAAKSMNILELKYHTKQESTDDMIRGFKAHGLL